MPFRPFGLLLAARQPIERAAQSGTSGTYQGPPNASGVPSGLIVTSLPVLTLYQSPPQAGGFTPSIGPSCVSAPWKFKGRFVSLLGFHDHGLIAVADALEPKRIAQVDGIGQCILVQVDSTTSKENRFP